MSIGIGNIIVQNKKEHAGVSDAESGLHMDGSKARLGGQLLENTDIDIDTNTFFLQWDGAAGAFLIDVFNDKYFFGTIDGSFNLETGFTFKENEAAIKLNGNAAVSARGQAGIGAGIVYEIGDVENVNNGTKITITEDTETVEITNIPEADFTTLENIYLQGNKIVKSSLSNKPVSSFTPSILLSNNINTISINTSEYWVSGNTVFINVKLRFKITDDSLRAYGSIDISDILTILNIEFDSLQFNAASAFYAPDFSPNGIAQAYINADDIAIGFEILPLITSGSETNLNTLYLTGFLTIKQLATP